MITRIVKMTFKKHQVLSFLEHFEIVKDKVRNQKGCLEVVLLHDVNNSNIYFTISKWQDVADLERYRTSAFFKEVWFYTKSMFEEKAAAWTLEGIDT